MKHELHKELQWACLLWTIRGKVTLSDSYHQLSVTCAY